MKDEYDFSGSPRGKFYRPNSRVRLPYHRGSQSWLDDVAVTGRWWQPPEHPGLVLLNPGMHTPSHLLVEEVTRWMGAEGAGYPNLAGVLVMAEVLIEPEPGVLGRLEQIVPVWRDEAPAWVKAGPWQDLSDALAARDLEALARRTAEGGGDRDDGGIPRSATG